MDKKPGDIAVDMLLSLLWLSFAYTQLLSYLSYYKLTSLLLFISETVLFVLFLLRRRATVVTRRISDYVVAMLGTFTIMLYFPTPQPDILAAEFVVIVALMIQLLSVLSLNRSFGIVPANRGIQVTGMYEIVRHPIYTGYLLMYIGYFLGNWSIYNTFVLCLALMFMIMRIYREEALLMRESEYKTYSTRVRWRLIPGIF